MSDTVHEHQPSRPTGDTGRNKRPGGVSYQHPVAFRLGVLVTTIGVLLQLPDFYACRTMHHHMAGMPISTNMAVGMVMLFIGVATTAYGLIPATVPRALPVDLDIGPLDNAPIRPAHIALLLVAAVAITIDVMKPTAFAFLSPGAAAEYGLRGPLNPHAHALPIALYPLSGITGTMIGSLVWGWYGDRIGRRASILLAAIIFIATSTCGTMTEYWMNLITCLIMGLAAGGMLPIMLPIALLYGFWSSKKTVLVVVALMGASLAAFVLLGDAVINRRWLLYVLLVIPVWGIGILNAVLAAYTAEVYPTVVRARGSGLSAGATKTGGVMILALTVAAITVPSIRITAAIGVIPMVLAALVLLALGPETTNQRLEQITQQKLDTSPEPTSAAQ